MKYNFDNMWSGMLGTAFTTLGATLSLDEIQKIVSIVVTIIGAIFTFIIMPLINWYRESKKDGKITKEEISEGINIAVDGGQKVINTIENSKDKKKGE